MRIRFDLPLDKPLRRGGNIVNLEGGKTWVTFRYERLPTFCYQCGWLGHDEKYCPSHPFNPNSPKQYEDWMKPGGNQKSSSEKSKFQNSWGYDEERPGKSSDRSVPVTVTLPNSELECLARSEIGFQNGQNSSTKVVVGLEGSTLLTAEKQGLKVTATGDRLLALKGLLRDKHNKEGSGKGTKDKSLRVGLPSAPLHEAQ